MLTENGHSLAKITATPSVSPPFEQRDEIPKSSMINLVRSESESVTTCPTATSARGLKGPQLGHSPDVVS